MTHGNPELCECLHDRSQHVDGTCLDCDPRTRGCDHEFTPYQAGPAPYLAKAAEGHEPEAEQDHLPSHEAEARAYASEQSRAGVEAAR